MEGTYPSTLYDLGASLYPKLISRDTSKLKDSEIMHIIKYESRCAILYKGKKKNYIELLSIYRNNDDLKRAVIRPLNKEYDFTDIYEYVIKYNSKYENHMIFIDRMLNFKYKILRSWLNNV